MQPSRHQTNRIIRRAELLQMRLIMGGIALASAVAAVAAVFPG